MLNVLGKKIHLTRGDTAYISVSLKDNNGNDYIPAEGDKLYFRLKKNIYKDSQILEKEISAETSVLELIPEDTEQLEFGTYCYEIELVTAKGEHFTVIENASFTVGLELEEH
ncbi:MAG: hypothetical protein IJG36_09305 [Synergistaceae bacterium]|nr:hypothetical protein [Synergistaceae bacterium]MBQ3759104.1 hypothetical protein [Synergistaceae bacterium]